MPISKNKGPLLVSKVRGGVDLFPKEFQAQSDLDIFEQDVPLDIEPDIIFEAVNGFSKLAESSIIQTQTNERKKINKFFTVFPFEPLDSQVKLESGLIGDQTVSIVPDPTDLVIDGNTESASQRNLGNGWLEQTKVESPSLFGHEVFGRERSIVTPDDFRALLTTSSFSETQDGNATDPLLAPGQISVNDEQLDVFHHRLSTRTIDLLHLPKSFVNSRTNQFKQVETVTRILEDDDTIPAMPTATLDVEFTNLGDGSALEIQTEVDVFPNTVARTHVSVLDAIPSEIRSVIKLHDHEETVEGFIDDPPVLLSGEISRTESQVTEFTKRIQTSSLDPFDLGVPIINLETTSQYGGGEVAVVITIDITPMEVDQGLMVLDSNVRTLVKDALFLRTSRFMEGSEYATLVSDTFEEETQGRTTKETQIVAPTYVPALGEDKIAIDKWKSQRILITKALNGHVSKDTAQIAYRFSPYPFPGTLDYNRLITFQHKEGFRKASAILVKHTIRTWWVTGPTIPTAGDQDIGSFDVDAKEIITDTVNVPIFRENDATGAETYTEVLHDDITNTLGAFYPATTPSFTKYYLGVDSGSGGTFGVPAMTANGTGYSVGDILHAGGHNFKVYSVGLAGPGEILAIFPDPLPPNRVFFVSATNLGNLGLMGGSGTGATAVITEVSYHNPIAGTQWVGTEKPISAQISHTDRPNLWKVVTESVVMR